MPAHHRLRRRPSPSRHRQDLPSARAGAVLAGAGAVDLKLLAQGRECDIFEVDERHVLRRSRRGDSLAAEMEAQAHARTHGYPTPAVIEIRNDGREAIIERVEGPTMLQAVMRKPWTAAAHGAVLADLHRKLADVPAMDGLRRVGDDDGESLLHLDLHPLNVILSPTGPVVIDWANAAVGPRSLDLALTWVIIGAAPVPGRALVKAIAGAVRDRLAGGYVEGLGREAVLVGLESAAEFRLRDRNLTPRERDAVQEFVSRRRRAA